MEQALWADGKRRVAGVDEAGLGSLCGPVIAAAVLVPEGCQMIDRVRDSKMLSRQQRERLFDEIVRQAASVGVGAASVREIERLNVRKASHLAMRRALERVGEYDHALVDGRPIRDSKLGPLTTIVDGDALCYSIACASIVAKVTRDHLLKKLAVRFPGYGWEKNAGYGSPQHLDALGRLGVTALHRRGFAPVQARIGENNV